MMVRVDICFVVREVNSYHHLILTLRVTSLVTTCCTSWYLLVVRVDMGTSWHILCRNICQLVPSSNTCFVGYELTSIGGTSWHGYELTWVWADMGTSWHGYEFTWVRVDTGTRWPVFVRFAAHLSVTEAPYNIASLRVSGEEIFCFCDTWSPNPRSPILQLGSSNRCSRAPALSAIQPARQTDSGTTSHL